MNKLNIFLAFLLLTSFVSTKYWLTDEDVINEFYKGLIKNSKTKEKELIQEKAAVEQGQKSLEPDARDAKSKELEARIQLEQLRRSKLTYQYAIAVCQVSKSGMSITIDNNLFICHSFEVPRWESQIRQISNKQWIPRASLLNYYTERRNHYNSSYEGCLESGGNWYPLLIGESSRFRFIGKTVWLNDYKRGNFHQISNCLSVDRSFRKYDFYIRKLNLDAQIADLDSKLSSCKKTGSFSQVSKDEDGSEVQQSVECTEELTADLQKNMSEIKQDINYLTAKYKMFKVSKKLTQLKRHLRYYESFGGRTGNGPFNNNRKRLYRVRIQQFTPKLYSQFSRFIAAQKNELARQNQEKEVQPTTSLGGRLLMMYRPPARVSVEEKLSQLVKVDQLLTKYNECERELDRLRGKVSFANYVINQRYMLTKESVALLPKLAWEIEEYQNLNKKMFEYYRTAVKSCIGGRKEVYVVDRNEACSAVHREFDEYRELDRTYYRLQLHYLNLLAKFTQRKITEQTLNRRIVSTNLEFDMFHRERSRSGSPASKPYTREESETLRFMNYRLEDLNNDLAKLEPVDIAADLMTVQKGTSRPQASQSTPVQLGKNQRAGSPAKFSVQPRRAQL